MGWPEMAGNGRKITNFPMVHGGSRSRRVRRRFALKFHQQDRLDVGHLLGRRVLPVAGACHRWPAGGVSSDHISHGSQMNKRPNSVPGLESSFLGFLELKKCLGG